MHLDLGSDVSVLQSEDIVEALVVKNYYVVVRGVQLEVSDRSLNSEELLDCACRLLLVNVHIYELHQIAP